MPTDDALSDSKTKTSPKQSSNKTPPRSEAPQPVEAQSVDAAVKPEAQEQHHQQQQQQQQQQQAGIADVAKALAPPPRPNPQANGDSTTNLFGAGTSGGGSLNLEPNPFEQSFGVGGSNAPETPGGTKLPSVAALTSPSSLLPGSGVTPFNWGGGSLRTGPLSPAMLSGPAGDYFSEHHLRGSFPTPNESSLRSGLTPGGSGSMFPAPSPNSQALFAQLANGATPGSLDFHRTAVSAAQAQRAQQQSQQAQQSTSAATAAGGGGEQPTAEQTNGNSSSNGNANIKTEAKPTGAFDNHDNDAANGLFLLAQGRNGAGRPGGYTSAAQQPVQAQSIKQSSTSPQMKNNNTNAASARGHSEAGSGPSDDGETSRPNTRGRGKRTNTSTSTRRKTDDATLVKIPPAKKAKANGGSAIPPPPQMDDMNSDEEEDEDDGMRTNPDGTKTKMTEEEKRKNFLERNRVAALKCRQRKKQWLANLQSKVEMFSSENDQLSTQISQLREEVVNLKTLLLAHKDCPVTQQQGLQGAFHGMEPYNQSQMNPYGMGNQMPNHQIMAGQGNQRRYS